MNKSKFRRTNQHPFFGFGDKEHMNIPAINFDQLAKGTFSSENKKIDKYLKADYGLKNW